MVEKHYGGGARANDDASRAPAGDHPITAMVNHEGNYPGSVGQPHLRVASKRASHPSAVNHEQRNRVLPGLLTDVGAEHNR